MSCTWLLYSLLFCLFLSDSSHLINWLFWMYQFLKRRIKNPRNSKDWSLHFTCILSMMYAFTIHGLFVFLRSGKSFLATILWGEFRSYIKLFQINNRVLITDWYIFTACGCYLTFPCLQPVCLIVRKDRIANTWKYFINVSCTSFWYGIMLNSWKSLYWYVNIVWGMASHSVM